MKEFSTQELALLNLGKQAEHTIFANILYIESSVAI